MIETLLKNPVTLDVVTRQSPRPTRARDVLVFTAQLPAGASGSQPHRDARLTESFEVLEGCMTFRLGKTERLLAAGEAVTVRPNAVHGFHNDPGAPAVLRGKVTPGSGFERVLRGLQSAAKAGRTTAAGRPCDPRRLTRQLLDADFRLPELPMGLQRALFRGLAALAPTATY